MFHKLFRSFFVLILITGLMAIQAPQLAHAAGPWYVSTTGDDSNDCLSPRTPCATINGAIGKASAGDTINVAVGTYTGSGTEVVLIDRDITLYGGWDETFTTQSGMSTIDGQSARMGMSVFSTALVEHFAILNGFFSGRGGGIRNAGGNLTLNNSTVSNNIADDGGGISNEGTMTINTSVVSGNTSNVFQGGGIQNWNTLIVNNSTINGNSSSGSLVNNWGGGGISNASFGTVILNNTTVSGNTTAAYGGGIFNYGGIVTVNNSTITKNTAQTGGGIYNNSGSNPSAVVTVKNTIVAGNTDSSAALDCIRVDSLGYNLIGNTSNCDFTPTTGDLINIDPDLGQLIGPSEAPKYHPLIAGSPAIDAGNPATPGSGGNACLATDQRGVARPVGTRCDIGAYEGFVLKVIPILFFPKGIITDTTPTFKWEKLNKATKYQIQLLKGTTVIYTKTVPASACKATQCADTPTSVLNVGAYKWKVRAMFGSAWKSYSPSMTFKIFPAKPGFWRGPGLEFYVTKSQASVDNFAIYINISGCGNYKITHTPLTPIVKKRFSFTGSFYANGTFTPDSKAKGSLGLKKFYIAGCGYITGGPWAWSANWKNKSQPTSMNLLSADNSSEFFVEPVVEMPPYPYIVESVSP
jgi:hypothetical protein